MTPPPRWSVVELAAILLALRAAQGTSRMLKINDNLVPFQIEVDMIDFPGFIETQ